MLDIRALLDRYRIKWRDRGKNVSHNNIVISCPFCNKSSNPDIGEHLSISTQGEYYCYRNPAHKGKYLPRLFRALDIPGFEFANETFHFDEQRTEKEQKDFSLIRFFQPANESQEALGYLKSRLFEDPIGACKKFRLMYDKEGKWAGRLIIPLTIGWTGRAMRDHIEPRYLAWTSEDGFFFYGYNSTSLIILEGAIDAMRIATVSSQFDVIAKCRSGVSPAIVNHIRKKRYLSVYNIPDNDVMFPQSFQETKMLRSYCSFAKVMQFGMPEDKKDFGVMTESYARRFLLQLS